MKDLLIRNARIVNEGTELEGDVLVDAGRIEKVASGIDAEVRQSIDAAGRLLLPGMIDDQVHFREPGLMHKGNFATESKAAVAGGITSYMEMPNTSPPTLDSAALEAKYARAAGRSAANYAFYLGASNDNLAAIQALDPNAAAGVKIFMGASTGNMLVDDPQILDAIFRDAPTLIATHCEDTPMIVAATRAAQDQYGEAIPPQEHPHIRSREACLKSSTFAVELARRHGAKLHVLHLTTADELALFESGPIGSKQITVEACVHHLYYDAAAYLQRGNRIKCNPAIKSPEDRLALLRAVAQDRIDIIATDHAPHLISEKDGPYMTAAAGMPLVQDALASLFRHVVEGHFDVHTLVRKTSHAVADRFEVVDRGYIREGYYADLTLVDPAASYVVEPENVLYHCGWSPFEGEKMHARVDATIVNGVIAYQEGKVLRTDLGRRLEFDRG